MATDSTPSDDSILTSLGDQARSVIDTLWADLDGDLDTEATTTTDGPFSVDVDVDAAFDDPFALPATDPGDLVGQPLSVLLPWESDPGFLDPWALPETGIDWMDLVPYDPMTACPDWTVDGWTDASAWGPVDAYGPTFDTAWLSEPGSYYDDSAFSTVPGYWDTTGYYETSADAYLPVDPGTAGDAPFDTGVGYDTTTGYESAWDSGVATTDTWDTSWDTSSSWDTPTVEDTSIWDPSGASAEGQMWQEEYQAASDLEWDYWNASTEAWLNGDNDLAYDLNQLSQEAGTYSDQAWNYSNDVWSDPGPYFDTSSTTVDTSSTWDTSSSWDTGTDTGSEW